MSENACARHSDLHVRKEEGVRCVLNSSWAQKSLTWAGINQVSLKVTSFSLAQVSTVGKRKQFLQFIFLLFSSQWSVYCLFGFKNLGIIFTYNSEPSL